MLQRLGREQCLLDFRVNDLQSFVVALAKRSWKNVQTVGSKSFVGTYVWNDHFGLLTRNKAAYHDWSVCQKSERYPRFDSRNAAFMECPDAGGAGSTGRCNISVKSSPPGFQIARSHVVVRLAGGPLCSDESLRGTDKSVPLVLSQQAVGVPARHAAMGFADRKNTSSMLVANVNRR